MFEQGQTVIDDPDVVILPYKNNTGLDHIVELSLLNGGLNRGKVNLGIKGVGSAWVTLCPRAVDDLIVALTFFRDQAQNG